MAKVRQAIGKRLSVLKRSLRKALARAVYSIPPLSTRSPRQRITTIHESCRAVNRMPSLEYEPATFSWRLPVLPPQTVHRQASLSVDDAEGKRFRAGTTRYQGGEHFELPEVSLACFNQARIFSEDFLVLSSDDRILFESAASRSDLLEANGILDCFIWPRASQSHGTAVLLAQISPHAYYHWVIEVLPKLSLLERFSELDSVPLIVCNRLTSFQRESLQMAGVPVHRMLSFDGDCWQFDRLVFPMLLGPSGCPSPHAVAWLRERFLKHAISPVGSPKRIYLTRRDASQRRVLNEDQVVAFLRKRGFEVVCVGELTFAQQIGLFRDVEIVVAPHGAGLTNMVFAQPGATLVEFFGDNYINGCFWALANLCGHKHACLTAPTETLDYNVPMQRLETLLAKVCQL